MKKLIPFIFILIGCGNNDEIVISKDEYKKLKGDTIKPEYPKPFKLIGGVESNGQVVLGTDEHEYIEINRMEHSYNVIHSPECIKCKNVDTLKTKE